MKSAFVLFAILILAVCLTQIASDIYAPSLPAIDDYDAKYKMKFL